MRWKFTLLVSLFVLNALGQSFSKDTFSDLDTFLMFHSEEFYSDSSYVQVESVQEGIELLRSFKVWSLLLDVRCIIDTNEKYFVSPEIRMLTGLREFSCISGTRIILPSTIGELDSLRVLDIQSVIYDSDLPAEISNCLGLQFVSLMGPNQLSKIPKGIRLSNSIRFITINFNRSHTSRLIKDLRKLSRKSSLKVVKIYNLDIPDKTKKDLQNIYQKRGKELWFI